MAAKITLISEGLAFITDALSKKLQSAGFEVNAIAPRVTEINECRNKTDSFLIYAGSFVSDCAEVFVYLKDVCSEDEKKISIIGYEGEIEDVENMVGSDYVALRISRPFDMQVMISKLEKFHEEDEERKKRKHILLIDDDPVYLKTVQGWLSSQYDITIARSGMQAITYIATHTPDLILLDYEMPVTSGPQVMEMMRNELDTENIPIIFLTGKSDKESVMSVVALKPQGYMLKSMTREQILGTIDDFFKTSKWKSI